MERYPGTSNVLTPGLAVVIGSVCSLLASTAYLRINKFEASLLLFCMVFAAWLFIERGAIGKLMAFPRRVFRPDRYFWLFLLKAIIIVWVGLGAYENFDIRSIRSSIIFALLLNILTGAFFESSRGIR